MIFHSVLPLNDCEFKALMEYLCSQHVYTRKTEWYKLKKSESEECEHKVYVNLNVRKSGAFEHVFDCMSSKASHPSV